MHGSGSARRWNSSGRLDIHDRGWQGQRPKHVRFAPKADKRQTIAACPLCANSDHSHRRKLQLYSITLSARATTAGGTVMPSSFADFRLTLNSNRTRRILLMANSKQALVVDAAAEA